MVLFVKHNAKRGRSTLTFAQKIPLLIFDFIDFWTFMILNFWAFKSGTIWGGRGGGSDP